MAQDVRNMSPTGQQAPASSFTLAATGTQTPPIRAIYVSVAGTVAWTDLDGNAITGIILTAGSTIPVMLRSIESLGSAVIYALR